MFLSATIGAVVGFVSYQLLMWVTMPSRRRNDPIAHHGGGKPEPEVMAHMGHRK
jgi:hypothetical protein